MPGFGMQGFAQDGAWRMSPFNGFGPMQPGMPSTGAGGFAPMPSGGMFGGSPLMGLAPNAGMTGGGQRPGVGGQQLSGSPLIGRGLQGPRPGGQWDYRPGQGSGGMMPPGAPAAMPGSGRSNPWAGDSIGDSPYWQKPAAPASPGMGQGMDLFAPQSNFQQNTRGFDGQNYSNQGDYWNKVGAFVDTINQDRSQLSGRSGQQIGPPPQRDFGSMWNQAGDKAQSGWQNPFAQQPSAGQQGGGQQATPGYGTDPSKRGGIRDARFLDRDGDRVDDRDQDGPGMPAYGRSQGGGGQNSGYVQGGGGQNSGYVQGGGQGGRGGQQTPFAAYGQPSGQGSSYGQGGQPSGQPASTPYSMDFGNKTMNVQPGPGKVSAYDPADPMKWVRDYQQSKGGQQAGQNFANKWNSVNATQGGQSPYSRVAASAPQSMYRR